ncbi:MAG: hypothetical protein RLZZ385_1474 [Pseudomonadota bacterium]|jgi:dihydroorotase
MTVDRITLTRPDDWHLHLRDGEQLAHTVPHSARYFRRAIVMPNLASPVTSAAAARAYRERILRHIPAGSPFEPLMTLYLTDTLSAAEIRSAHSQGDVHAVKYYPAGATTNSENGVTDIEKVYEALECMADIGLPLLVHGEVTDSRVDIFDREAVFIERVLEPLRRRIPQLRIVLEHITTADAVQYVSEQNNRLAATITAHHLLLNRNNLLAGGVRPHFYCLPILKRNVHQVALLNAVASGSPRFFLGTDSAPHARTAKEAACGCAGIFTAHGALELYAEAFESVDALHHLEAFAAFNGPDFYGLPRNTDTITLERVEWTVPDSYSFGSAQLIPLRAGETLGWRVTSA